MWIFKRLKMKAIFVYGTLQQPNTQLELVGRVQIGELDSISNYVVVNDYVDIEDGIAYPRIVFYPNGIVYGRIHYYTDSEIEVLDKYETEMYKRINLVTMMGIEAEIYMPSYS